MTLFDVIILLVVAGVCGSLGQAISGYSRGGCLVSIALGFVGALVGMWLARVMGLPEVFADPQVRDQEMLLTQHHPGHGDVKMLGFPVKFGEAPCRLRLPAPELGADTEAVLREFGYSAEAIAGLRRAGAI